METRQFVHIRSIRIIFVHINSNDIHIIRYSDALLLVAAVPSACLQGKKKKKRKFIIYVYICNLQNSFTIFCTLLLLCVATYSVAWLPISSFSSFSILHFVKWMCAVCSIKFLLLPPCLVHLTPFLLSLVSITLHLSEWVFFGGGPLPMNGPPATSFCHFFAHPSSNRLFVHSFSLSIQRPSL